MTPPPKKTCTAAPAAAAQGGVQSSQAQKVVSTSCDESQRHFRDVRVRSSQHWQVPEVLHRVSLQRSVGLLQHPVRHWPACFDQTCGYPGEGPLTTLDSPEAPGMSLTPTQGFMTCDMIKRKTREKEGPHEICGACGSTLRRRQNGLKCRKCHVWPCNTARGGDVVDLQCCRLTGVASHDSQSQSCPQGLGSSAVEGTPRLTQGMEQAMDVQMGDVQTAAVQSDLQLASERVAYRAALRCLPPFPAMPAAPMGVCDRSADAE